MPIHDLTSQSPWSRAVAQDIRVCSYMENFERMEPPLADFERSFQGPEFGEKTAVAAGCGSSAGTGKLHPSAPHRIFSKPAARLLIPRALGHRSGS